jgi:ribosomal protein L5
MRKSKSVGFLNLEILELTKRVKSKRGCEAEYFDIPERKFGIKTYQTFEEAYRGWNRQKIAHKAKVAPKTGKIVVIKKSKSENWRFGYETEKAIPVKETSVLWKKESDKLLQKLVKIKFSGDFHTANCGILRNKLVYLDFGDCCEM